jgi:hypothetical protein
VLSCVYGGISAGWSSPKESHRLSTWLRNCKTEVKVYYRLQRRQIIIIIIIVSRVWVTIDGVWIGNWIY